MKIILDIMWVIGTPFRAFVASVFSVICFFALLLILLFCRNRIDYEVEECLDSIIGVWKWTFLRRSREN